MKRYRMITGVAIIVTIMAISYVKTMEVEHVRKEQSIIILDAGHGGYDPGKVGVSGVLEKDANLVIAQKTRYYLEQENYEVILTRNEDIDLAGEYTGSKKSADLQKRVEIMNVSGPAIGVSIHQNSFTDPNVRGAQVFYYDGSEAGKKLADCIQSAIKETIGDENHRVPKANSSYYLLKKVKAPIVIVECGFLSNPEEELLLMEESYQDKMAKGIAKGIEDYLDSD